ncbi:amidase family protein [Mycoplasma nasistruthionis]|uniref:Asp-tRNA(Asn)/Glu-tRNA(Gln) amidotransferase subunit GatA n=1 Tax=Mycoplasma nasistruthionis TaxID=353852 RepID=A0A4Y6I5R5_9MOLU|nr:amidase family protein [Mycoplasma nasistruthionis]QDF64956.1 Asp-tRNA(Asn)/Glu-tRNA(Gln) amidotransferase subunit GatA [Mycoplasma nasistruthionis]
MQNYKYKGNFELALKEMQNDTNNAVSHLFSDGLISQNPSNTILKDVVFTIKDVFATKDAKTQASSKILLNFQPGYNATVVSKLLDASAKAVSKVNNDELALGGTGTYSGFGLITNPLDPKRLVGGSSSGSAATMTKNVGLALGSDTGDSVRLPASYNGLVGFKPSYGAISRYGMFAYASSLDTVAYFTHDVSDTIEVARATYGLDDKDMTTKEVELPVNQSLKPAKVLALDLSEFCQDFVNNAYNTVLNKLKENNIAVEVIKPNLDILRAINIVYRVVSFSEASSNLANLNGVAFGNRVEKDTWQDIMHSTRSTHFGQMVQERLALGSYFLYTENQQEVFIKAQKARTVIANYLNSLHEQADVVIYPAFASIAPLLDEDTSQYDVMNYILTGANLAGNPSITIPLGTYNDLPFNLAIDAKRYNDAKLLSHALYIQGLIKE